MIADLKKYFGWNDQDEIILSAVGFPTTASAIIQNNLKPIFVDITWDDLNWDLTQIENLINTESNLDIKNELTNFLADLNAWVLVDPTNPNFPIASEIIKNYYR